MRLPFTLSKPKSTDNFVPLTERRGRGLSASSAPTTPNAAGRRPLSTITLAPADLQLLHLDDELDTMMDEMGIANDQRTAMLSLNADNKARLVQTHKLSRPQSTVAEHLRILSGASTQSLPLARLERLRVDILCQTIQQTSAFVEGGGLRLLLAHLAQLNERVASRTDQVAKEYELLRCVSGLVKVNPQLPSVHAVVDSLGSHYLPNTVAALKILLAVAQPMCTAVLSALFHRDADSKRPLPFTEWMASLSRTIGQADAQEFAHASLALVTALLDSLPQLTSRARLYERLDAHNMLVGFLRLEPPVERWEELLRRDYNLARSQGDKSGFVACYERMQAELSEHAADPMLSMYPGTTQGALTPTNPFYSSPREMVAAEPEFIVHGRSQSNVAETGSLRDLRPTNETVALVATAHEMLKKAAQQDALALRGSRAAEAARELHAVVRLAQDMLSVLEQKTQ
ncbi:hypothetical protein GGI25_003612 [Coemansia spiralis]|uniref:Formin GTPase-binding domain-containing protein n=2 Tax=Coemansia TaxID=4863 RepID=A0A9W8KXC4_9FUNG|nr:hypothetical protein EDC05_000051 [Coemansia umbellata]KAJ2626082.1 hypothetical protein GGI26_000166 [Coemansia sp. RSA 1358]KAJ2676225.1 hypothetical protein GGI25_003612 [Coemansia spiralis]